jgi:broad specificity phosphatase PhoE
VLIVSHKTSLRVVTAGLLGLPLTEYRRRVSLPGGSLTVVAAGLVTVGSLDHLSAEVRHLAHP